MTDAEQHLAALLGDLPGHHDGPFWRGFKAAAGIPRIRQAMSCAVRDAERGDFVPLAELVLDAFNRDARLEEMAKALAAPLGSAQRGRAWITVAVAAADRVIRPGSGDPLGALSKKW